MKRGVLLGVIFAGLGFPALHAQEPKPDLPPRYRLIQVIEASTVQEKINEAAGEGYRLVRLASVPGGTLAAIMEKVGSPSDPYEYVFHEVKASLRHPAHVDLQEQLNARGAQGFHLHTTLDAEFVGGIRISKRPPFPGLLVMEKPPGPPSPSQYEVLLQGLESFSEKKTASLIDQGFRLAQPASLWRSILIFEKIPETQGSGAAQGAQRSMHSSQGYRFLVNRLNRHTLPEKQLLKAAAEGARVVAIFRLGEGPVTAAMEPTAGLPAPYEYLVIKRERLNSALALKLKMSEVGEEDLNRAGENGFQLFQQNSLFFPFVMEKAPGSTKRFQYRLLESARLSELSQRLEEASGQGYHVVAMSGMMDGTAVGGPPMDAGDQHPGIAIVMEKSSAADSK